MNLLDYRSGSQGSEAAEPASCGITELPFALKTKHRKGGTAQLLGLPAGTRAGP